MKSIPVALRIDSVCGCRTAVGSGESMAAAVEFILATDSVTAITFCRVSSSASRRASNTAAAPAPEDQDQQQRQLPAEQLARDTRSAAAPAPVRFRIRTTTPPVGQFVNEMNLLVTWLTARIEHFTIARDVPNTRSLDMTDTQRAGHRQSPPGKRDRTHWLYIAVIVAVLAGIVVGLLAPEVGSSLGVLGTLFVSLIKMMIAPVIFCTIVLGIGSVRKAASVGRVGGIALDLLPADVHRGAGHRPAGRQHHQPRNRTEHRRRPGCGCGTRRESARVRRHDGVHHRHHPDLAAVLADRGQHPAGPVRGVAGRVRPAGHGHDGRADPARDRV